MNNTIRNNPKFGKRGIIRFRFVYGGDEWDFGYTTIFFIQQLGIGPLLAKSDQDAIKQLHEFRVFELCATAEKARVEMADFELDGVQTLYFVKMIDYFCYLLIHPTSEKLADKIVNLMRRKHARFKTGKSLMDFYLPLASDILADFNEHYKTAERGKETLKYMWRDKKDMP